MSLRNNGKILTVLIFIILISFSYANILVTISPKTSEKVLFPFEIGEYELVIQNDSNTIEKNLLFKVFSGKNIILVKNNRDITNLEFKVDSLNPKERKNFPIKAKPTSFAANNATIIVKYTKNEYFYKFEREIKIRNNPVKIVSRVSKTAIESNEENQLILDIENLSNETITNLKAELKTQNEDFEVKSNPQLSNVLEPGQAITNSKFMFKSNPNIIGNKRITLILTYKENNELHRIEKTFEIEIGNRRALIFVILGSIVAIIAITVFMGKTNIFNGKKKKEENSNSEDENDSKKSNSEEKIEKNNVKKKTKAVFASEKIS